MKRGDVVKIYQRPATEENYEGKARLVKRLKMPHSPVNQDRWVEYWKVVFGDDKCPEITQRGILVEKYYAKE